MGLQIGLSDKDWKKSSLLTHLLFCMLIRSSHMTFSSNIASQFSSGMPKSFILCSRAVCINKRQLTKNTVVSCDCKGYIINYNTDVQ